MNQIICEQLEFFLCRSVGRLVKIKMIEVTYVGIIDNVDAYYFCDVVCLQIEINSTKIYVMIIVKIRKTFLTLHDKISK